MFYFPKYERRKVQWMKNIPRSNWTPTTNTVVCIKHFAERDVIRSVEYDDKEGNSRSFELDRPKLSPSAVPCIFPSLPTYLSIVEPPERRDPEERRAEQVSRHESVVQEWLDSDIISDYGELLMNYRSKLLTRFKQWTVQECDDLLLLYIVEVTPVPCFRASITIDASLKVRVFQKEL